MSLLLNSVASYLAHFFSSVVDGGGLSKSMTLKTTKWKNRFIELNNSTPYNRKNIEKYLDINPKLSYQKPI